MTAYRVGEHGATVWSSDGRLLGSLPAGVTIVPAVEGTPPRPPTAVAIDPEAERLRRYRDKVIRPERGPTA